MRVHAVEEGLEVGAELGYKVVVEAGAELGKKELGAKEEAAAVKVKPEI